MQDDVGLEQYNVGERVNDFVKASLEKASFIQGNNIMWMFGNDFNYQYAAQNYQNMDKLLRAVNADGRIIAFYSTPARYVEAKLSEVQQQEEQGRQERQREGRDAAATADEDETTTIAYPVKRDDFFPYADQPHAYWTGYFTSRPTQKFYNKYASAYLQTARQIQLLGMVSKESSTAEREHHFAPPTDDPMAFVAPNEPSVTAPGMISPSDVVAPPSDAGMTTPPPPNTPNVLPEGKVVDGVKSGPLTCSMALEIRIWSSWSA